MKKILAILLCVILSIGLCACSASKQEVSDNIIGPMNGAPSYDSSFESGSFAPESDKVIDSTTPDYPSDDEGSTTTNDYLQSQKLIYTCNIKMQSKTFENTMQAIKALIEEYNGFVESEKLSDNSYSWYYSDYEKNGATLSASLTIRIPADNYTEFLNAMSGHGKILSKSENVQNITKQYSETSSKIIMLEKEEQMLLEMMEKCTTIAEMITVEERLARVQQQLVSYRNTLSGMDSSVAFSTIYLSLDEVVEYQPDPIKDPSFIERVMDAVKDSASSFAEAAEELFITIIYLAPYIVIVAILFMVFRLRIKAKRKARLTTSTAHVVNNREINTDKKQEEQSNK